LSKLTLQEDSRIGIANTKHLKSSSERHHLSVIMTLIEIPLIF
jgi:hypothetical protein